MSIPADLLKTELDDPTERKVFLGALDFDDPVERLGYLETVCAGNTAMIERVVRLLDRVGDQDPDEIGTKSISSIYFDEMVGEEAGDRIGNYTLIERLGQGSFGDVWKASQEKPVRREVALKILKLGMDTREVLARFAQERQALAVLDHPNIAKVHDAGTTPSGRPFFAMELIQEARTISEFCEEREAGLEDRILLVGKVARTVQHAHRRGIVHRDLKPSNILVSGGDLNEVKVIDFGIAKASRGTVLTDLTIRTIADQPMGTPAYMSPEQFAGSAGVDTRTDVYSLGVILYELLTGVNPFAGEDDGRFGKDPSDRVAKKPSTRARSLRTPQSDRFASELRGDLDSITLKALDPEPDRRYESPGALADDLNRYLRGEPVMARPHGAWYVAKLFARRHRGSVAAGAVVLLALTTGLTVASVSLVREKSAREEADRELARSRKVSEILNNTLKSAGASFTLGRDPTMMKEILAKSAEGLETELASQPEIEAEIRMILGGTYQDLTDYENATIHYSRAVELRRELFEKDKDDRLLGEAIYQLAENVLSLGDSKRAEALAREAIEIFEAHDWEDPHAKRVKITQVESLVGWIMFQSGRGEEAEEMMRRGYEFWLENPENEQLHHITKTYGTLLWRIGKSPEAEIVFRTELEQFRKNYGHEHPDVCESLVNFATILIANGKLDEAERLCEESLSQGRKFFDDRNPHGDHALGHLATIAARRGDFEKEMELRREAVASCKRTYPPGSVHRRGPINSMVQALFRHAERTAKEGEIPAAEKLLNELELLGNENPEAKIDASRFDSLRAGLAKLAR